MFVPKWKYYRLLDDCEYNSLWRKHYEGLYYDLLKRQREEREDAALNNNIGKLLAEIVKRTGIPQPESNDLYFSIKSGDIGWFNFANGGLSLPDNVAEYVDDYYGGKVIKQEATKVVILDENGNATYSQTKRKPKKGKKFIVVYK